MIFMLLPNISRLFSPPKFVMNCNIADIQITEIPLKLPLSFFSQFHWKLLLRLTDAPEKKRCPYVNEWKWKFNSFVLELKFYYKSKKDKLTEITEIHSATWCINWRREYTIDFPLHAYADITFLRGIILEPWNYKCPL